MRTIKFSQEMNIGGGTKIVLSTECVIEEDAESAFDAGVKAAELIDMFTTGYTSGGSK